MLFTHQVEPTVKINCGLKWETPEGCRNGHFSQAIRFYVRNSRSLLLMRSERTASTFRTVLPCGEQSATRFMFLFIFRFLGLSVLRTVPDEVFSMYFLFVRIVSNAHKLPVTLLPSSVPYGEKSTRITAIRNTFLFCIYMIKWSCSFNCFFTFIFPLSIPPKQTNLNVNLTSGWEQLF